MCESGALMQNFAWQKEIREARLARNSQEPTHGHTIRVRTPTGVVSRKFGVASHYQVYTKSQKYWNLFHLSCIFNIHLKRPSWHKAWSLTEIFRLPENHDQAALRAVSPCLGRPKETLLAWYEQVYGGKRKSASLRSSRFLSFSKCSQTGGKLRKSPLAPPYFSPIFGLTPGVLLRSPAFSLLVRSLHHLKKERNWLLRRLEECSSELVK